MNLLCIHPGRATFRFPTCLNTCGRLPMYSSRNHASCLLGSHLHNVFHPTRSTPPSHPCYSQSSRLHNSCRRPSRSDPCHLFCFQPIRQCSDFHQPTSNCQSHAYDLPCSSPQNGFRRSTLLRPVRPVSRLSTNPGIWHR